MRPVSAPLIEGIVRNRLGCITKAVKTAGRGKVRASIEDLPDTEYRELVREFVMRVTISREDIAILFDAHAVAGHTGTPAKRLFKLLRKELPAEDKIEADENFTITIPMHFCVRGGIKRVEGWDKSDWTTAKIGRFWPVPAPSKPHF
jgi:hypothetical protein